MAGKNRLRKAGPRPKHAKGAWGPNVPGSDYLLDAALENWPHILNMYRLFEQKKPLMLYDIQEQRVYAYPYLEFKQNMSERSGLALEEQYERAVREGKIVVFVRDNEQRRLVSSSMDPE